MSSQIGYGQYIHPGQFSSITNPTRSMWVAPLVLYFFVLGILDKFSLI